MHKIRHCLLLICAGLLPFATPASSQPIITPTGATFGGSVFVSPERLIDGSGLSGVGPILSQTHSGGFGVNGHDGANFKTDHGNGFAHSIIFNLGGTFTLTDVHIWNYTHAVHAFYIDRDTRTLDIALSTDGISFTPAGSITLSTSSAFAEAVQSFPLSGTASHVRFQITSGHGATVHGAEVGLGEVRFGGLCTPDPSTYTLRSLLKTLVE